MNLNDFEISALERKETGSGVARALRNKGMVPGVLYGNDVIIHISLNVRELNKLVASKTLFTHFTNLKIANKNYLVFAKIIQKDPVTEEILHIDFQIVQKGQTIKFKVPVMFLNKEICEPIKLGGVLNIIHRTVELKGKVEDLPDSISFDLQNLLAQAKINTQSINLPKGVEFTSRYVNTNVASILGAKKKGSAETEGEASKAAA